MGIRNGSAGFGWPSRLLHWLIAAGILGTLGFGVWLGRRQISLDTLWLYALHKSIGLTLLILVVVRLAWHRLSPPPAPLDVRGAPAWQARAARVTHRALYALMLAIPLCGWIASSATGIDTMFWGLTAPAIAPVSEAWENAFFFLHRWLGRALMALIALHVGAALWHALVWRDGTLARMLSGRPPERLETPPDRS
jgi:cytochrome b561